MSDLSVELCPSMTVLENASYVELSRPEVDGRLACSFCDRTSSHDHQFSGRWGVSTN